MRSQQLLHAARRAELTCGDIILYHGQHPMHLLHERRTGCFWGQVGLLLELPRLQRLCVLEATRISLCSDISLGRVVHGVQIVDLIDRMQVFGGEVAFRRLSPPLTRAERLGLLEFADEHHGRPFNGEKWVGPNALRRRNSSPSQESFFCSELVASAYRRIGLLERPPIGYYANNFVPADFNSDYPRSILKLCGDRTMAAEFRLVISEMQ